MKCINVHKGFTNCAWLLKHHYYGYYVSDLILSYSTLQPHLLMLRFLYAGSLFLIRQVLCPWSHLFRQAFPDHLSTLLPTHLYSPGQFLSQFCPALFIWHYLCVCITSLIVIWLLTLLQSINYMPCLLLCPRAYNNMWQILSIQK